MKTEIHAVAKGGKSTSVVVYETTKEATIAVPKTINEFYNLGLKEIPFPKEGESMASRFTDNGDMTVIIVD